MPRTTAATRTVSYLLVALVLAGGFLTIGRGSLAPWDEALTGERIREMVDSGDWLTPHLYGRPDFNKPPLYYWLSAPVWYLVGPGEFAVRFWSTLFAAACVLLVYHSVVATGMRRTWGLLAAGLLLTNPHWQNSTRMGLLDSGFTLSVLAGVRLLAGPDLTLRRAILGGLVLATGSLLKYPLALLAIPAIVMADWLRFRRVAWRRLLLATGVAAGILAVWALLQFARHGTAWLAFQEYNFVDRFTRNVEGHATSWRIYWDQLVTLARVQLYLLVIAVVGALLKGRRGIHLAAPQLAFLAIWVVLMVVTSSKRSVYLLPAYPFAAAATAIMLGGICPPSRRRVVLVVVACLALYNLFPRYDRSLAGSPHMAAVGTHIQQNRRDGEFVFTTDGQQRQVLAFYADTIAGHTCNKGLESWAARDNVRAGTGGYLCVTAAEAVEAESVLLTRLRAVYTIHTVLANRDFVAFRLTPRSETTGVNYRFGAGWRAPEPWGRWANGTAAALHVPAVSLPAILVIRAASWPGQPGIPTCRVIVDGKDVGSFAVRTAPWRWEDYVIEIGGSGVQSLDIELRFTQQGGDRADPDRRSLPVAEVRMIPLLPSES